MAKAISTLGANDLVRLGKLHGQDITWLCADVNHSGYPANSRCLVSERILKVLPFDAKEPSSGDSNHRQYGNNRYDRSNIDSWLNSSAASSWYYARHAADAPPSASNVSGNAYQSLPGFLYEFPERERNLFLQMSLPTRLSTYDGSSLIYVSTKVFLLSHTELGITVSGGPTGEGVKHTRFSTAESRLARPTATCIQYSEPMGRDDFNVNNYWYQWTRSIRTSSNASIYCVGNAANLVQDSVCFNGWPGIRPAICIPADTLVTDAPVNGAYNLVFNQPPTVPASITVPDGIQGGTQITVRWGASSDPDGNLAGYQLERSNNGGAFAQIFRGNAQQAVDNITFGWNTVQYRVKAYDTENAESGYNTSAVRNITNNRPPAISGSDANLGTLVTAFPSQNYTVTDPDGNTVTVTERLDGAVLRTYTASLGAQNTLQITAAKWLTILNGAHTATITAVDSYGVSVVRTFTFTKTVSVVDFKLSQPKTSATMPTKCILNFVGQAPAGSSLQIRVCNNGFDAQPAWEDITQKVLNGQKHFFSNTSKTAASWGVDVWVTLNRGTATQPGFVVSINGAFE